MEIAVLGGGNGCYAAAAALSERGHAVRFWRRDAAALRPVLDSQSIRIRDHRGERAVAIARPTTDIGEAVRGAELIVVPTPAFAQADIAAAMAPHLSDGQVVFLPPGTFGSVVMAKRLRELDCVAKVAFAETGTLPWLVRKHGDAAVAISATATRLPTGVFPASATDHALEVIGRAFPGAVERCEDALSGALMNAGPVIHPPLILMNAGPIEHFERWDIHNEGTQPSIRRVTDQLDAERVAIREALGYRAPHFPLADHYASEGPEWMYGRTGHEKLVDSGDWRERLDLKAHRYMLEDVGHGLAFLVSVGEWAGVPCPVAAGLLAIGSAVAGRDFRRTGRTLGTLGLDGLDRAGMARLLAQGL
ncbi:NAD/NADP-dependent octopine/nopaline dehydrogenase family protein [Azospirillum thermophilum]|uniref:Glycerol-3-phosphate dehydrogenase n=1 Tax=Azospirillum thermophilum TaxID=2202148 RepID=A0A2S2CZI5_9PROT|nr:NAD/NADP-dependent octopine/nopaline dehydrogenase family protein [Azospirillum thermophilum]AWK89845.1 glycerol-3-phosphate dehydrogenase [Azospirillum thermophilum]